MHGALSAADAGVVLLAEEVEVDHAPFQLQALDSWEKVVEKKIQHYFQLLNLLVVWYVWEIYPHKYPVHSHAPEDLFSLLVDPFFSAVDLYAY